jgi:hypothetical protein
VALLSGRLEAVEISPASGAIDERRRPSRECRCVTNRVLPAIDGCVRRM